MGIKAFPKIFHIGEPYIEKLFDNEVEITSKIDGSMLVYGRVDGELQIRSKGTRIFPENVPKMFIEGVNYVLSIEDKIPNNTVFYTEYLQKPKHNVLCYSRVPKNHMALFGVSDENQNFVKDYRELQKYAEMIDIEVVPLLYEGYIKSADELTKFLETESALGNTKVEGIVVKNYHQPFLLGGQPIPIMMGKLVREDFKEVHRKTWNSENTSKGRWELFKESYRTEARWQKAVQHLREMNELENSPRDIGKLIKEVQNDIIEEEKENIKNFLWQEYGQELLRYSTKGCAEWYKKYLAEKALEKI